MFISPKIIIKECTKETKIILLVFLAQQGSIFAPMYLHLQWRIRVT